MPRPADVNPVTAFWDRVNIVFDWKSCWEWGGCVSRHTGYGMVVRGNRSRGAHRYAFEISHWTPIPKGMVVRHRCDNRRCVRPTHLQLGTYRDNNRDTVERGRHRTRFTGKTHCQRGHEYPPPNKSGWRKCLQCAYARQRGEIK